MGFSRVSKTGSGIHVSDIDSGGSIINSYMYGDPYEDTYNTNAGGGYNTDLFKASAIVTEDGTVKNIDANETVSVQRPDLGIIDPSTIDSSAKVVPSTVNQYATGPHAGFIGGDPFSDPTYSIPEKDVFNPDPEIDPTGGDGKDKQPTIYDAIKDTDDLRDAYFAGSLNEAQVKAWFDMKGFTPEVQKEFWDSWSKPVDTGLPVKGSTPTSVAGANIGTANTNEKGEPIYTPGSYSSVSWSPIYQSYLRSKFSGTTNPMVYGFHRQQGLSNDPLQRTAHTQFLVQATEDAPWADDGLDKGELYAGLGTDPNSNAYADFLDKYRPLEGRGLLQRKVWVRFKSRR